MLRTGIQNARDLAEAASRGRLAELFPTMDQWLPELIASISWSVRLSPHFMLIYHFDADDSAFLDQDTFLAECEQCRDQILGCFDTPAPTKMEREALKSHLTILLLHVKSTITFGSLVRPHLLLYLLDREQDPDYMVKFRHEMAHWLWGSMYGEAPAFLNEGVAVAAETLSAPEKVEADLFSNLRSADKVPPLEDLCRNEEFWRAGTAFYRIAGTFVYFLVQRWGWDRVAELFRHTSYDDMAISSVFARVFGISLKEADAHWRDFLRSRANGLCRE